MKYENNNLTVKLFINFLIGGAVIASVSYAATFVNPVVGAILWSFPFTILPSVYFLNQNNKSNNYISKFLLSTTYSIGLLVIVTFALSYFIKNTSGDYSIEFAIVKATILWFVMASLFYFISVTYFGKLFL